MLLIIFPIVVEKHGQLSTRNEEIETFNPVSLLHFFSNYITALTFSIPSTRFNSLQPPFSVLRIRRNNTGGEGWTPGANIITVLTEFDTNISGLQKSV
jgi:hypothetical protein